MRIAWVVAKGAPPEPLSGGEAALAVGLVLGGLLLAVVIAAVRWRFDQTAGRGARRF